MKIITKNRRAYFEYTILEKLTAGIELQGSEVKSIRANNVSIAEAYCFIRYGEIFIKGMHVNEHKQGGIHNNHVPNRERKLLLKKKEIISLHEKTSQRGLTIMPLSIILSTTGFIKIEIGLAKGKNLYDKRVSIKEKELNREIDRHT